MTRAELAEVLRARFRRVRWNLPELIAEVDAMPDDRCLASSMRCGGCGEWLLTFEQLDAELPGIDTEQAFADLIQRLGEAHAEGRDCLEKMRAVEDAVQQGRPVQ